LTGALADTVAFCQRSEALSFLKIFGWEYPDTDFGWILKNRRVAKAEKKEYAHATGATEETTDVICDRY
jgi:hypothetical protein